MKGDRSPRRWVALVAVGVTVLGIGALIGWAVSAVFAPPRDVLDATAYTYVELVDGEVGSSIALNTVAKWDQEAAGTNQSAGTVTAVRVGAGDEVAPGAVLYEVDLREVVVAEGLTPAFRAMARGTEGEDVAQLQGLLAELGFYQGVQDGGFGALTEAAVRQWQESLGIAIDGVVQAGDVIFVPTLPGRVALDTEQVFRGAALSGGEQVVSALAAEPTFVVPVTTQQAAMMPTGTAVELTIKDQVWFASVGGQEPSTDASGQVNVALNGVNGAPVCGDQCALLPVEGESLLVSRIITQKTVSGVVAPSAALVTAADGTLSVIDSEGVSRTVRVVASAQGMSVIDGVQVGMRVRVPASADTGA